MNAFKKANNYYSEMRYEQAIKFYEKVDPKDSVYNTALYNVAVCMLKLNRYEEAIEVYGKVLDINPIHQKSIFNLGYCYAQLNNKKKALIYFNRAWALDNDDESCSKAINLILKTYKGMGI
jgi:tetratricopeptide (TPR) repeat protein